MPVGSQSVNGYLEKLIESHKAHLSDKTLTRLIDGELSGRRTVRAHEHFSACDRCRLRYMQYSRVVGLIAFHHERLAHQERNGCVATKPLRSGTDPSSFIMNTRLLHIHSALLARFRMDRAGIARLSLLGTCVAALLTFALYLPFSRRSPRMTPTEFLQHSVSAANTTRGTGADVLRETIQIRTAGRTLRRTLYRDPTGKQHPKLPSLRAGDASLETKLTVAGIGWNDPLSPFSFKDWHDHQRKPKDEVQHNSSDLLTLTTTVPDGAVRQESLTVRESNFHPVERTVKFQDNSVVEIAELDYTSVGQSAVTAGYFEPLAPHPFPSDSDQPRSLHLLTPAELDEAELRTMLTLNRLHADDGEQIEIHRNALSIAVNGVVDSDERKRELEEKLSALPHVQVSLLSGADAEVQSRTNVSGGESAAADSALSGASPLEVWLKASGKGTGDLNQLSKHLLDCAFTAESDAWAIEEILRRFPSREGMTLVAVAVREDLLARHQERLLAALHEEERVLAHAGLSPVVASPSVSGSQPEMVLRSKRNIALVKELILAAEANARPAESIAGDLNAAIEQLQAQAKTESLIHVALNQ